jgi:hypothetical protein
MRKPNDRHGDKNPETKDDLKLALDADELTELSNKESESDSKRAVVTKSAVNVDMLSLDKSTLDTISTNQRALKAFVSLLETDVAMFKKYNLVRLLAVASVRLERLIFESTSIRRINQVYFGSTLTLFVSLVCSQQIPALRTTPAAPSSSLKQ